MKPARRGRGTRHGARLARAILFGSAAALLAEIGAAQTLDPPGAPSGDPDPQMYLEADQLVYDFDREVVSAEGGVRIAYEGYTVTAARITYDQRSGRLIASGGVRIVEPDGNIVTAREIDVTDDLRDGFLQSLNVETVERARFAAASAERRDGDVTIFRQGVYTACEPCREHPERPPLWQIKAAKIIHDKTERTVTYEDATLEFFGVPIAYVPVLYHPDPTVKRKTGFLAPELHQREKLGFGVTTPFFWNLAPHYDVTFAPTFYTEQGVLGETTWRHRLVSGAYSVHLAGIFQRDPQAFAGLSGDQDFRGSVRTAGSFDINSRWRWGWDIFGSTDRTFGRDYGILGAEALDVPSTIFLTGLGERSFFDLRAYYFRVQRENRIEYDYGSLEALLDEERHSAPLVVHDDQDEQAIVHPVLDHNYVVDRPVAGGELRFDSNLTSLTREESDVAVRPPINHLPGVAGTFTRASTSGSWQRTFIAPGGQVLTPFAYVRTDLNWLEPDDPFADLDPGLVPRAMPALGLEYRWPFVAEAAGVTQTFSPVAQFILRPDEAHIGELPNEDAQSLVFDDTNLFSWDKFSGYDRIEGGTRANLGVTYSAYFANGVSVDAVAGQSIQLAGTNSFAERDLTLTGVESGLESDVSDYVGGLVLNSGRGLSLATRGRFDQETLSLERGEVSATAAHGRSSASLSYVFLRERPVLGITEDREEMSGSAVAALGDSWSVMGSLTYDIENRARVGHSLGLAYDDECFNLSATYSETRDRYTDIPTSQQVFVRLNLRTIGDTQLTRKLEP